MAINKKLIHFKNRKTFDQEVAKNNILDTSIVFIQDSQEIWTHGTLYANRNVDFQYTAESSSGVITDQNQLDLIKKASCLYCQAIEFDTDVYYVYQRSSVSDSTIAFIRMTDSGSVLKLYVDIYTGEWYISDAIQSLTNASILTNKTLLQN